MLICGLNNSGGSVEYSNLMTRKLWDLFIEGATGKRRITQKPRVRNTRL